jgi:hypothetical protein
MATTTAKRASDERSQEANTSDSSRKQRPIWTRRGFPVQVAVFEFANENGPPNFSVKLTRSYRRDEKSNWETSDYLGGNDLLRAARLLEAADAFIQNRLELDYQAKKASADDNGGDAPF